MVVIPTGNMFTGKKSRDQCSPAELLGQRTSQRMRSILSSAMHQKPLEILSEESGRTGCNCRGFLM
jgi:hypothetical protein